MECVCVCAHACSHVCEWVCGSCVSVRARSGNKIVWFSLLRIIASVFTHWVKVWRGSVTPRHLSDVVFLFLPR